MQYVYRKAINQHIVVISCNINKEKNEIIKNLNKTRSKPIKKLQYTITILPEDILPYARFVTANIISAIDCYVSGNCSSYQEAALHMGAENEKTFKKYYLRAQQNLNFWLTEVSAKTSSPAEKILKQTAMQKNPWQSYSDLVNAYSKEYDKIPGTINIPGGKIHAHFQVHFVQCGHGLTHQRARCPHPVRTLGPPNF